MDKRITCLKFALYITLGMYIISTGRNYRAIFLLPEKETHQIEKIE